MGQRVSRRLLLAGLPALAAPRLACGDERVPILDTHIHLLRGVRRRESVDAMVAVALRAMDEFGIEKAIASPPPFPAGHPGLYGLAELKAALRGQPRLAFIAGGDSLNPILQSTPADRVSESDRRRFADAAQEIVTSGAAGFGELAAEHFSNGRGHHPYESSPPDHPLLLQLADIAAAQGMPIELHMEAVPQDMPMPPEHERGPNPGRLNANIPRFERLLAHNPKARIVWLHAGWDLTGERTVPLMRSLLERHANLAMSVKYDGHGHRKTQPFPPEGDSLKPGWLAMIRAFSDRFVVGSDQFIDQETDRFEGARRFVDALPPDLARRVASENAKHLYRLTA